MTMASGYVRIMQAVYKRGFDAAAGHYLEPPDPPYKRADYRKMWQLGFDTATKHIQEAIRQIDERTKHQNN